MGAGASKRRFHVGFKPRCSALLGASCAVGVTECPRWVCSQGEASYRPQHSMARASSALRRSAPSLPLGTKPLLLPTCYK